MDNENLPGGAQGDEEAEDTLPAAEAAAAPEVDPGEKPETPEEPGAKPAEKPTGIQKRIDELTRARHEAERKAAYWEGKAQGQKPDAGQGEPHPEAKPKQDAFESYEAYIEAVADWKVSQRLEVERARIREESRAQTVEQSFQAQVKAAREKFADFDAVVYNKDLQISETMREVVLQADDGATLAYLLGQHPEEAARIAQLQPTAQILAIGRLQAKLDAASTPAPAASNAPAPITPVKANAPSHTGLREDLSIGDWMKRRNAELNRR